MSNANGTQRRMIAQRLQQAEMEERMEAARNAFLGRLIEGTSLMLSSLCTAAEDLHAVTMTLMVSFAVQVKIPVDVLQKQVTETYERMAKEHAAREATNPPVTQ